MGKMKSNGLSSSKLYNIYHNMKQRCYDKNRQNYKYYGGRGIKICDEWLEYDHNTKINTGFLNFYNWAMNNGYEDSLSIDRIDENGNYCPENCRWVTQKIQCNNKSDTHYIEYMGYNFPISIWSEITKIKHSTIYDRLRNGWSPEQALRTPPLASRWDGEYLSWNIPISYIKFHNPDVKSFVITKRDNRHITRSPSNYKGVLNRPSVARKLNEDQIALIKSMKSQGYSNRELAAIFNVSNVTISNIITEKLYKFF